MNRVRQLRRPEFETKRIATGIDVQPCVPQLKGARDEDVVRTQRDRVGAKLDLRPDQ